MSSIMELIDINLEEQKNIEKQAIKLREQIRTQMSKEDIKQLADYFGYMYSLGTLDAPLKAPSLALLRRFDDNQEKAQDFVGSVTNFHIDVLQKWECARVVMSYGWLLLIRAADEINEMNTSFLGKEKENE